MRRYLPTVLLLVVMSIGLAPQEVVGQTSPETEKKAGKLFQEGAELYYQGEYARALVKFKTAYRLNQEPMILYNLSLTHAKLGNLDAALETAVQAQEMGLPDKAAPRNAGRIAALRRILAARSNAEDQAEAAAEASLVGKADEPTPDAEVDADADRPMFGAKGWVGLAALIAGGGALATAGVVESQIQEDLDRYRQAGAESNDAEYHALRDDLERRQRMGKALIIGGGSLMVLGGVLFGLDLASGPETSDIAFDVRFGQETSFSLRWTY